MMLLAIETSTELVGVSVGDHLEGARASMWVTGRRRHAEIVAPGILEVLAHAGVGLEEIEAVAVDIGPGLFTGLRVGIATAKGLAQGLGVGLVPVGSLEVLAAASAAAQVGPGPTIVAAVDARRGEVFAARYRHRSRSTATSGHRRELDELSPPLRYTPAALVEELHRLTDDVRSGPVLVVGDGARRYQQELAAVPGVTIAGPSLDGPDPAVLLHLAASRLADGEPAAHPSAVTANYLREADAIINWATRHAAAEPTPEPAGEPA